nr:cycloartenol-C-24-methyltransferase-like [Tanacetum cinerariifolium]
MDMYMVLKKYKKQVWLCKNKWSRLFKTLEEINFRNMSLLIILEFLMRKHKECETEIGDGLPDIRYTKQCLAALKTRLYRTDHAGDSPLPCAKAGVELVS